MTLAGFVKELLESGQVTVMGEPMALAAEDQDAVLHQLRQFHAEDAVHQPYQAPNFDPDAALWAARYVYRVVQLVLVRELDDTAVQVWLQDFSGSPTPEAVYSVDLTFRYLPILLHLAQGLAPADALVARLQATAQQWPFSFVGTATPEPTPAAILEHPSLRTAYADRIIAARDLARAQEPAVAELVRAALGNYASTLWPDWATSLL
ncbi:hypothetical protein [Hymenobacter sp. AT01-02]|uniref:MoxR-vWA-beta-propeller ternary system domain-containing protein n=2 Tax=Hymenobacter mucosus TaxID=1411120 RepID=A0A238ZFT8_9BACT|nr:hypothetical protein [Hymenobacter sp. AT01-02]SNR82375.1 hypothetical protein SAMN06269173_10819 [Hymenobacter mucosus]